MKIKQIEIANYRAYHVQDDQEAGRYIIDLPEGANLLIYGENGSGKSSLYNALKDFIASAVDTTLPFKTNLFYDDKQNSEQPFIAVTLTDNSGHFFSAEPARTNTHYSPVIGEANITRGFISYRDLLLLHFSHHHHRTDLFSLFLGQEGLFSGLAAPAPLLPANRIPFGELWKRILEHKDQARLDDYNVNVYDLFQQLEAKANLLLSRFQNNLNVRIKYTDGRIQANEVIPPVIDLDVKLFDREIQEHGDVLNEARLTAIAISIYLGYILVMPASELRVLFLDDIFIGLDMSNRIPLIEILTAENLGDGTSFRPYQIFVTTYDREWFHVAKTYLTKNWEKAEFYVVNDGITGDRPFIRKYDTYRQRAEFHLLQSDYPACANYLRKAFEQVLRAILPDNIAYGGVTGDVTADNAMVIVDKSHFSIKETPETWLFIPGASAGSGPSPFRTLTLHSLIERFNAFMKKNNIPFRNAEELIRVKNRLLNPLSHDNIKSPVYKSELKQAFLVLDELSQVRSEIIVNVTDTDQALLYYEVADEKKNVYRYTFQLYENLRYIEHEGVGCFVNAACKAISRRLKPTGAEEPLTDKMRNSVYEFCKVATHYVTKKKDSIPDLVHIYPDRVFTADGKSLTDLI